MNHKSSSEKQQLEREKSVHYSQICVPRDAMNQHPRESATTKSETASIKTQQ